MQKHFKRLELDLTPEEFVPPSSGGGSGEGETQDGEGNSNNPSSPANEAGEMGEGFANSGEDLFEKLADELNKSNNKNSQSDAKEFSYKEALQKIDTEIIRDMLTKLVSQNGRKKIRGTIYYDKKKIVKDSVLDLDFRIPFETFDFKKNPMWFYFDFSGSCEEYSGMFAQITAGLIEKGATTYIGMNGLVNFRIDRAPKSCTAKDINLLMQRPDLAKSKGFEIVTYNKRTTLEDLVVEENVHDLLAYTDYDSIRNLFRASKLTNVVWFSAQGGHTKKYNLDDFLGSFYLGRNIKEIKQTLYNLGNPSFERKCRNIQMHGKSS